MAGVAFLVVILVVRFVAYARMRHANAFCFLVSFAGLGFLSLYLAGKLHLFDRRSYTVCTISHLSVYALIVPP
jgi:hypothetical protein